ncbi:hypothetical protein PGT21_028291 [Puccinia graminis f. sp. tritici]|uniref:Uncharacterized protein n=1 Tax=Puccinia graminis f. sp. tritici TaxID=56615 RepID=A0A5B0QJM6_PUCGR|nr:hypothetical protein PGT21_028291 [Puccinia graminis f. sp. tritici]
MGGCPEHDPPSSPIVCLWKSSSSSSATTPIIQRSLGKYSIIIGRYSENWNAGSSAAVSSSSARLANTQISNLQSAPHPPLQSLISYPSIYYPLHSSQSQSLSLPASSSSSSEKMTYVVI